MKRQRIELPPASSGYHPHGLAVKIKGPFSARLTPADQPAASAQLYQLAASPGDAAPAAVDSAPDDTSPSPSGSAPSLPSASAAASEP